MGKQPRQVLDSYYSSLSYILASWLFQKVTVVQEYLLDMMLKWNTVILEMTSHNYFYDIYVKCYKNVR